MRSVKQLIWFSFFLMLFSTRLLAQSVEGPPSNTSPDVESMTLDRTVVYLKCSKGDNAPAECNYNKAQHVEVITTVYDKENSPVTITYHVTAGRIVGQGRKVYWYLAEGKPGVHSITAIADDGGGPKGKRVTKEVEVKECDRCPHQ